MSKWTDIRHGTISGAEQRFWVALGPHAERVAILMNSDEGYLDRLVKFAIANPNSNDFKTTPIADMVRISQNTQWLKARAIMGRNFFGVEEAIKHYGVNPTPAQLAALAEIPWSEAQLQAVCQTHVLAAIFPLSILEIRGRVANNKTKLFYNQDWYNNQAFAGAKGEIRWQLVKKTPVENSTGQTWPDQQVLLTQDEETPIAQVMVYTIIGHFLATGERLFNNVYVRCSDLDASGYRVHVGHVVVDGLRLHDYGDDGVHDDLGLASGRKF